jgi:hypothetical protein
MRTALRSFCLAVLAMIAAGPTQAAEACDRACLSGLITTYVDALVARAPTRLPLAAKVKITEDSREIKLGEGVWKTVTGKGTFRHDYIDLKEQVAATHVHLMEGDTPLLYSLVLHVTDRKIAGIETLVQRITKESPFQPKELGRPVRGMNDAIPAGQKMSRANMIKIALTYPEGLRVGNFTDGATPFAPDTYRVENGVITAGGGCGREDCGMYAQRITVHPGIIASVAAVDEENGTVLLWMNFGDVASYGTGKSLVTYEAFKVWGNQIHAINAFFGVFPASTPRFWESIAATK